jgi:signal transduction histidine kinase
MPEPSKHRLQWLAAVVAAAWSASFLAPLGMPASLLPVGFGLGCWLLWRTPVVGAMAVCAVQAAGLASGVPADSAAGLAPGLFALAVLGVRVPLRRALALLVVFFAIIVATDLPAGRTMVGLALFAGTYALARLSGRGRRAVERARRRARDLAERDVEAAAEAVVAAEHARITRSTVDIIRAAVQDMRGDALLALDTLAPEPISRLRQRGGTATGELSTLLALLRTTTAGEPTAAVARAAAARPAWLLDLAVAAAAFLVAVAEIVLVGAARPATTMLALATCAALTLRRSLPGLACLLAAVPALAANLLAVPNAHELTEQLALAALTWTMVTSPRRWHLAVPWAVAAAMTLWSAEVRSFSHLVVSGAVVAVVMLGGAGWAGIRSSRAEALSQVADLDARLDHAVRTALADGRSRMGRDLHDVASHALGVMLIQAGAAEALRVIDPARAREALRVVAAAGAGALLELDTVGMALGACSPLSPPSLAPALDALTDRVRSTGTELVVDLSGRPPDAVTVPLYRVVREALTNAVKHAPGAPITVVITAGTRAVDVRVRNGPPTAAPLSGGAGTGLQGLAELVDECAGSVAAGPCADGGFELRSRLPLPAPSPAPAPAPAQGASVMADR